MVDVCFHCGDSIEDEVLFEQKSFCCQSCATVYEILHKHDLEEYYKLENKPGIKGKSVSSDKFAFLELEEIKDQLLDFKEGDIEKVNLYIPKIHCSSCIWLLEQLGIFNKGIIRSNVNFVKKELSVTYRSSKISLRELVELLHSLAYDPNISLKQEVSEKRQSVSRTLLIKLGVAGFCFGNVMLLSFPEYLSLDFNLDQQYGRFFGYLNFLFSLPVVFYCSTDYFIRAYKGLRQRIVNLDVPISLGIMALFIKSCMDLFLYDEAGYFDSLCGLLFFMLIGKWYQQKTYEALSFERDYTSYFPLAVSRVLDGVEEIIPIEKLESGDTILIRNEELIPADGILLSDKANIDYSFVTGESRTVKKIKGDKLFAGGRQIGSQILLQTEKEASQSYLSSLWQQDVFKKEVKGLGTLVDVVSKYFTFILLALALVSALFWWVVDPSQIVHVVTSILIVACPCALALALPFTFGNAIRILGRYQFFLRDAMVIEQLGKVDTIIFDKTGTLTESANSKISFIGEDLSKDELQFLVSVCMESKHPLSKQIAKFYHIHPLPVEGYKEVEGKGLEGTVNATFVKLGSASFLGVQTNTSDTSGSIVHLMLNNQYKGYFLIKAAYRSGLEEMIQKLGGYHLAVLSGDNKGEKAYLQTIFPTTTEMRFNQQPMDKLSFVLEQQQKGRSVLMIGDGLNDAGALKQANCGISIGEDVYNFFPACDGILKAESFHLLNGILKYCKGCISIAKFNFGISILYNTIGISFAISANLSPLVAAILMPMSSITVVIFASTLSHFLRIRIFR